MSETYKYLDKELSKIYFTDEDIIISKRQLARLLEDHHKTETENNFMSVKDIEEYTTDESLGFAPIDSDQDREHYSGLLKGIENGIEAQKEHILKKLLK